MTERNIPVLSVGKIYDLFNGRGISIKTEAKNNNEVVSKVIANLSIFEHGLMFANLVDFDMLWGHRNDYVSFGKGLEAFDLRLPEILIELCKSDLLLITADHGCDPTLEHSTDHTREYVPLLAYSPSIKEGNDLGIRETFADIASTVAENFGLTYNFPGNSFLKKIKTGLAND